MSEPSICPKCGSDKTWKQGIKHGRQMIQCQTCGKYSLLPKLAGGPTVVRDDQIAPAAPVGIVSLAKVIERYDVVSAIRRELAQLPKGRLILETELSQRVVGKDRYRFNRCIENNADTFRPFRIQLKLDDGEKKWYWAGAEDIAEALRIRDL